eukprot:gene1958-biopygen12443
MTRGGARRAGAVRAEEFHPAVGHNPPPPSSPSPGPSAATCLVSCGVRNIDIHKKTTTLEVAVRKAARGSVAAQPAGEEAARRPR